MTVRVEHGDCRDVIKSLADCSIDSCVTDPPYSLVSIQKRFGKPGQAPAKFGKDGLYQRASSGFMGQQWDTGETAHDPAFWAEVLRVLKPGAHLVAFAGTRTYHRMACAIEDAGFEIRDQIGWAFGSGFPKSHDVSKGIDRSRAGLAFKEIRDYLRLTIKIAAVTHAHIKQHLGYPADSGVVSHWVGISQPGVPGWDDWQMLKTILPLDGRFDDLIRTAERDKIAVGKSGIATAFGDGEWSGAGAQDFSITAPATDAAREWEGWGTALKPAWEPICLARKPLSESTIAANVLKWGTGAINVDGCRIECIKPLLRAIDSSERNNPILHTKSATNTGEISDVGRWPANLCHDGSEEVIAAFPSAFGAVSNGRKGVAGLYGDGIGAADQSPSYADGGSAARFFYSAKADASDRLGSKHPTVKPVDLMRWLTRLVTQPHGLVLDPFAGTGTTGMACMAEGFDCILIEREARYVADIKNRIAHVSGENGPLFAQDQNKTS